MKAVVLHGPKNYPNNYEVMEVEKPTCGPGDILLLMKAAALCGTDKRIFTGAKTKGVRKDSIVGHEISGRIVETGNQVTSFSVGDRVAVANVIPCGNCPACLDGRENACLNRQAIGYEFNGGFAEYILIPEIAIERGNVVKLPDDVTYASGALIEPLACCIRGLKNVGTQFADTVVIIGAGPIGLMHVQLSKAVGASRIIVSEFDADKRKRALEVGATAVINPQDENLVDRVLAETNGLGADRVIMAIGVNQLVQDALRITRKGGTLNLFAGFAKGALAEIDPSIIHYNEITVTGSTAYTRKDYHESAEMVFSKRIDLDALVSKTYTLDDFRQALEDHMSGKYLKIVILNEKEE
ncbi:zinc-dependent dehydrogenase [Murdochiella vaginalis]|uniref:zinc-dependent dehydrogenase n=1 Tax=Murdochiella vaginalis TaxID=1852373 RepID=UPI0008FDE85D|nr:zinc-dependent dehydrogenase [Murdochiella vaginalis]